MTQGRCGEIHLDNLGPHSDYLGATPYGVHAAELEMITSFYTTRTTLEFHELSLNIS